MFTADSKFISIFDAKGQLENKLGPMYLLSVFNVEFNKL